MERIDIAICSWIVAYHAVSLHSPKNIRGSVPYTDIPYEFSSEFQVQLLCYIVTLNDFVQCSYLYL